MTQQPTNEISKNLKFLFISADKYPPFRVDVTVLFCKEIVERGHKIDWILQSDADCKKSYIKRKKSGLVWVGKTDNGSSRLARLKKHVLDIVNDLRVFSLARDNDYDFIQVKDKCIAAIFALISAKLYRKKFFFWLSFPFPEAAIYAAKIGTARYPIFYRVKGVVFKHLLYTLILHKAEHIFVQSEQMKRDLAGYGVAVNKITPVPMGVSLDTIPYDGSRAPVDTAAIVYLGTLAKERRIEFLVTVLDIVKSKIPKAKLYLVGDGDDVTDRDVIMEKVIGLGLQGSVTITGFLPREEAMDYVAKANVCVSPFYPTPILNSTSPTKLVEYMAMGRPVVANDHPEQRLVIKESAAGICVPYEEQQFAAAIVKILENKKIAIEMGERGRRYVESKRSYNRIADDVEGQYYRLCLHGYVS